MTIEFKPCPFCGETPAPTKHFKEDMWRMIHRCPIVGAIMFDWADDVNHIAKQWNTRKP
jgi:hypothetical protein